MTQKMTINTNIEELDRNVFAVSSSLDGYAKKLVYEFNQKIETELLQKQTIGSLTRIKQQIDTELKRRNRSEIAINVSLTDRQIEFCKEFIKAKGVENWQEIVAEKMTLAVTTVKTHKSNVFNALCVNTQAELMHTLLTTDDWKLTQWEKQKAGK